MMKFYFALLLFVLVSCSLLPVNINAPDLIERRYFIEKLKTDYFEEWGLFRTTGYGIYLKWNKKVVPNDSSIEKVCRDISGSRGFFAGRIYQDDLSKKLVVDCFSHLTEPMNSSTLNDLLIRKMLNQYRNVWVLKDSVFKILYGGDSIQILSGVYHNHRLVCAENDRQKCTFNSDFEKKRNDIYFDGPFYVISLPAKGRVRSLIVRNVFKNPSAYVPLKLDPAILPLESPGYKKLREQEESLLSR